MPTKTIAQFSEVIAAVVRLAEDNPDQKADQLYFDREDKPCCIFGHAFASLGFTPADITAAAHEHDYGIADLNLRDMGIREFSDDQLNWAAAVQNAQDRGATWQQAVAGAGQAPA